MIIKINDPYDDPKCPYQNCPEEEYEPDHVSISSHWCVNKCPHKGPKGIQNIQADCNHPKYIHSIMIMIPPEEIVPAIL